MCSQVEHLIPAVGDVVPHHIRGWGTNEESLLWYGGIQGWEEDILFVVGGNGTTPSSCQPGAQYEKVTDVIVRCNEQHMFTLSTSE